MQLPIEVPKELQKKLAKNLQTSGFLKKIERKIKIGMMVALEEIREDPSSCSHLVKRPPKTVNIYEQRALQTIYNFLSKNHMTYTLSALIEESCIDKSPQESPDILELISEAELDINEEEYVFEEEEEEIPKYQTRHRYLGDE